MIWFASLSFLNFFIYVKILTYSCLDWIYQVSDKNINLSWLETDLNLSLVSAIILITAFIVVPLFKKGNRINILIWGYILVTFLYLMLCIEAWTTFSHLKWLLSDYLPDVLGRIDSYNLDYDPKRDKEFLANYLVNGSIYSKVINYKGEGLGFFHFIVTFFSGIGSSLAFFFICFKIYTWLKILVGVFFNLHKKENWKDYCSSISFFMSITNFIHLSPCIILIVCALLRDLSQLVLGIDGPASYFWIVLWHPLFFILLCIKSYPIILRAIAVKKVPLYLFLIMVSTAIVCFDILVSKICLIELLTPFLDNPEHKWGESLMLKPFGLLSYIFWVISKYF